MNKVNLESIEALKNATLSYWFLSCFFILFLSSHSDKSNLSQNDI